MHIEFTAFARTTEGRGASRRMRRAGKAPGIVYGGATAPQPIELDHNALFHALRNEAFHASILSMSLSGAVTKVLLRDVQMHPFRNEILHVDFQRIDENRKIHMKVPLHFVNGENSPAVKTSGAIVSHVLTELLDISCLPKDLPEFIKRRPFDARRRSFGARVGTGAPAAGLSSPRLAESSILWSRRPWCRRRRSRRPRRPRLPKPQSAAAAAAAPGATPVDAKGAETKGRGEGWRRERRRQERVWQGRQEEVSAY